MTRQRKAQMRNNAQGLCSRSASHGPVHRGGKCRECYQKDLERYRARHPNARTYKKRHHAAIEKFAARIATHQKWISKYESIIKELNARI